MATPKQNGEGIFPPQTKQFDCDITESKCVENGDEENLKKAVDSPGDGEHSSLLGKSERDLSNIKTVITLFKVFTGPSMLGMPVIIKNGGLVLGTVGFLVIGLLNMYCNITLVKCCRLLTNRTGKKSIAYEEVMESCFLLHSEKKFFLKMAPVIKKLTVVLLIMSQLGILAFYVKTIGSILEEQLKVAISGYSLPFQVTELFVCLCIIPYSWMRNLRVLSWFSAVANVLILVCATTILQYVCQRLKPADSLPYVTQDPWTLPLFIGSTAFTVEGIPMILPIENKVKNPEAFGGCFGLIAVATSLNITLNLAVGFFGYLALGDDVHGNVLLDLPDEWVYELIRCIYGIVVFLTFPLQLYLPAEVLGSSIKHHFRTGWVNSYSHIIARTFSAIVIYLFAALVPKIDLLMSFVGAFTTVTVVFVFPPMAELLIMKKEPGGAPWYIYTKCSILLLCGLVACFTGTYTSVRDMVREF